MRTSTRTKPEPEITSGITHTSTSTVSHWKLPGVEAILDPAVVETLHSNIDQQRAKAIEDALKVLGAPGKVVDIQRGPTVTRYGVEPEYLETRTGEKTRVRVGQIAKLTNDLSLALAATVRIQAPVPGKSFMGIEVPNPKTSLVGLREVMESAKFKGIRSTLRIALGKDVSGQPVVADLAAMPHLLIAGTTGSGKSVCVNSILACLLLDNYPGRSAADPGRPQARGTDRLQRHPAPAGAGGCGYRRVVGALQWMIREMDNRYQRFAEAACATS